MPLGFRLTSITMSSCFGEEMSGDCPRQRNASACLATAKGTPPYAFRQANRNRVGPQAYEDMRCSLLGDSFSIFSFVHSGGCVVPSLSLHQWSSNG